MHVCWEGHVLVETKEIIMAETDKNLKRRKQSPSHQGKQGESPPESSKEEDLSGSKSPSGFS